MAASSEIPSQSASGQAVVHAGEKFTPTGPAGLYVPEQQDRKRNIRETIVIPEEKLQEVKPGKYNSPGVDPTNRYNAFFKPEALTNTNETADQEPVVEVLEEVAKSTTETEAKVSEQDAEIRLMKAELAKKDAEIKELREMLKIVQAQLAELTKQMAELTKMTQERKAKYEKTEASENSENSESPEKENPDQETIPMESDKVDSEKDKVSPEDQDTKEKEKQQDLGLNPGDHVRYKDREGNYVEGILVAVSDLANEEYVIYHVRNKDGKKVLVSFAYRSDAEGGEKGPIPQPMPELGPRLFSTNYPELYAQRKNLLSTKEGQKRLEEEGRRVTENMANFVSAGVMEFMRTNPNATNEQINHVQQSLWVQATNYLEREIIDHVDGRKVDGQETKGTLKGAARRFNAWMDRHGNKIKKALMTVGVIGLAATGVGVAAGAISLGAALGAGTVFGAAKGATAGMLWQRHGSKNSEARNVAALLQSNEWQATVAGMDPTNRAHYMALANYLVSQFDASADQDHTKNVKRTRRAAIVGAALGAIAGSVRVYTPYTETIPGVQKDIPPAESHIIAPKELSGQVLDKQLALNNINLPEFLQSHNITGYGESFTLPDGSTNEPLIHAIERTLGANFGEITADGTKSYAGLDALSNDPLNANLLSVFSAIYEAAKGGTTPPTYISGSEYSLPWTFAVAGSGSLMGDAIAKISGDRRSQQLNGRRVAAA